MASTSSASLSTRNKTNIWLVGQISSKLSQTKLPSISEVLRLFFYYKSEMKQSIRNSANSTTCDVLAVWEKAAIPTILKKHVIKKIEQYFGEWQKLKKNKENRAKRSEGLKRKEDEWQQKLQDLFDIAHAEALNIISIEEDRQFLISQRERGRPGQIGGIDKASFKKVIENRKKKERLQMLQKREKEDIKALTEKCVLSSSTSSDNDTSSESEISVPVGLSKIYPPPCKRVHTELIDSRLAASLDVTKLSDRKAAAVLTFTLKSVGYDPRDFNISSSSIRRQRIKHRQRIAASLKSEFKLDIPLTIHWDSKLKEDIAGSETVDRLPILVSGLGTDQLLSVPKLARGTGNACASAVHEAIVSWNLNDQIKSMCFDTTAANTGLKNGACISLEQKMEKNMLWLACRHHVMEIMLEAIVTEALGPSSGPEILIFKRFKNAWKNIDQHNFNTVSSDASALKEVEHIATYMISFSRTQFSKYQPRDDYKELLNLTIIFLGGDPDKKISFRAPAGLHRARWMAKAIYCLKIFLFRDQFVMSKREEKAIREICIFTVAIYVKHWFQAPMGCSAPKNDLQLLKDLKVFENTNHPMSNAAMKKFLGHLWYLFEELVAFAFFDDEISTSTKQKMVMALNNEGLENCPKRASLDVNLIPNKNIEDFVSSNTLNFFNILGISTKFLKMNVEFWNNNEDYQAAKDIVRSIRVVNDIAERGVALIEEYNKLITTNEEQKQYLLLLVKQYRQKYPDSKKSTLLS